MKAVGIENGFQKKWKFRQKLRMLTKYQIISPTQPDIVIKDLKSKNSKTPARYAVRCSPLTIGWILFQWKRYIFVIIAAPI